MRCVKFLRFPCSPFVSAAPFPYSSMPLRPHSAVLSSYPIISTIPRVSSRRLHALRFWRLVRLVRPVRLVWKLSANPTHPSTEMRSTVLSPLHHLRRTLDSLLAKLIPSTPTATLSLTSPFPTTRVKGWTSLYEMVTFRPDVGYGEALRRERWQRGVINWASWMTGVGAVAGLGGVGVWAAQRWFKRR